MSNINYVDVNIFIYPVVNPIKDSKALSSKKILDRIVKNDISAITSFLSWDEFVYSIRKFLGKELAVTEGKKLLEFPNLKFLKVDEEVIQKAQDLITKYNLKPRDAIHAASALINDAVLIISDDPDFDKMIELIKRIKLES